MEREIFWLRMIDLDGGFVGALRIEGGRDHVDLPITLIARTATRMNAARIHLSHNHPSGNCRPSSADIDATRQIWRMARALGIGLQDHVITSDTDCFSFRAHGLL